MPESNRNGTDLPLLQAAVESAGEAVVITDLDGRITYVNPAFERITGWTRNEALGKTPRILNSRRHPPELFEKLWKTITQGRVWRGSFINRRKDGTFYNVEQTISPVSQNGQTVAYVSVHRDVTDRVQLQKQLRQATEEKLRLAEGQIELARSIQQKLYPQHAPGIPGFEIAGATFPAESTCGDYFDYIPFPDGTLGIVVGDVSGHGLGPAMHMTQTRAYLRALCQAHESLETILWELNQVLVQDGKTGLFVTMFLARIDPRSGLLTYAAAGHEGHLVRKDGSVETLDSTGMVLGLVPGMDYQLGPSQELAPGDRLLLTTDGLTETQSPEDELWGTGRMLDTLAAHRDLPLRDAIGQLRSAAQEFAAEGPQADDITIVMVKRT